MSRASRQFPYLWLALAALSHVALSGAVTQDRYAGATLLVLFVAGAALRWALLATRAAADPWQVKTARAMTLYGGLSALAWSAQALLGLPLAPVGYGIAVLLCLGALAVAVRYRAGCSDGSTCSTS